MSKFAMVNRPPEKLEKGCITITSPNFYPEILTCDKRKPRTGVSTTNYLRELIDLIGFKYIGSHFNAITDVNISKFIGIPCSTKEETHELLYRIFQESYPDMLHAYIRYNLKNRPFGTKLIYFTGSLYHTTEFTRNGIDEIKFNEIPSYLGLKTKDTKTKEKVNSEE
jgi:hypothetical protein